MTLFGRCVDLSIMCHTSAFGECAGLHISSLWMGLEPLPVVFFFFFFHSFPFYFTNGYLQIDNKYLHRLPPPTTTTKATTTKTATTMVHGTSGDATTATNNNDESGSRLLKRRMTGKCGVTEFYGGDGVTE
jgi:hypothetical protein